MVLFVLFALFIAANIVAFLAKDRVSRVIRKQIMAVLIAVLALSLSNIWYIVRYHGNTLSTLFISIGTSAAILAGLAVGIKRDKEVARIIDGKQAIVYLAIIIAFVAASISVIYTYPLWDAACYTESINVTTAKFDYGLRTNIVDYYLCSHISLGYTFVLLIGNFLIKGNVGPLLAQVLFAALSGCAFYEVLRHIEQKSEFSGAPHKISWKAILVLCLYMLSPAVFGVVGDLSVDYGMMSFLPFLALALLKKWDYLAMLFGIGFCMTKEPAVMIYAGLVGGICLFEIKKRKYQDWLVKALPLVVWFILYKFCGMWGGGVSFSGGTNSFGYDKTNILIKLKQFFVLNYSWLLLACIAVGIVFYFISKVKNHNRIDKEIIKYIVSMTLGFILYICFSFFYLTAVHYRYVMIISFWMASVIAVLFFNTKLLYGVKYACVLALDVLLLLQSFVDTDPVSAKKFARLLTDESGKEQCRLDMSVDDGIIINRSYGNYIRTIERALFGAGMDENTIIIIPYEFGSYSLSGYQPHGFYMDYAQQRFSRDMEVYSDHLTEWNGRITTVGLLDEYAKNGGARVVCIDFPWASYNAINEFEGKIDIENTFEITQGQWKAKVYAGTIIAQDA